MHAVAVCLAIIIFILLFVKLKTIGEDISHKIESSISYIVHSNYIHCLPVPDAV